MMIFFRWSAFSLLPQRINFINEPLATWTEFMFSSKTVGLGLICAVETNVAHALNIFVKR